MNINLSELRKFSRILVTGPARSGTTIASKILAHELSYECILEEEYDVHDLHKAFDLWKYNSEVVIQGPSLASYCHLFNPPGAVVWMIRPLEEIVKSQQRVSWQIPKQEIISYLVSDPAQIAKVKLDCWINYQKSLIEDRCFELDYHSLSQHPLWIPDHLRTHFQLRQISNVSP